VGKIIYLRQHYHFGPAKIAMYLKRYHDIQLSPIAWRSGMPKAVPSSRARRPGAVGGFDCGHVPVQDGRQPAVGLHR
jgi:hypothetical protein